MIKSITAPDGVVQARGEIQSVDGGVVVNNTYFAVPPFVLTDDPLPVPVTTPTREQLKAEREAKVAAIKVTTQAGNTFDGDETSQTRMTRAITALMAVGGTVNWVLADNTVIQTDAAELTEALALSGAAQAAIWVI